MLLKRRLPRIQTDTTETYEGFEHIDAAALALLRWLKANHVEFVLVGPVAAAIRSQEFDTGPVAIVPAPYRRNLERLARALDAAGAAIRLDGVGIDGGTDTTPTKLTAEKLSRGQLWTLRCAGYDLDVESHVPGLTSYQNLLYEAGFQPSAEFYLAAILLAGAICCVAVVMPSSAHR